MQLCFPASPLLRQTDVDLAKEGMMRLELKAMGKEKWYGASKPEFSRWDARASAFKEQNYAILGGPNTFTFQVVSDTFQKLLPRHAE